MHNEMRLNENHSDQIPPCFSFKILYMFSEILRLRFLKSRVEIVMLTPTVCEAGKAVPMQGILFPSQGEPEMHVALG